MTSVQKDGADSVFIALKLLGSVLLAFPTMGVLWALTKWLSLIVTNPLKIMTAPALLVSIPHDAVMVSLSGGFLWADNCDVDLRIGIIPVACVFFFWLTKGWRWLEF